MLTRAANSKLANEERLPAGRGWRHPLYTVSRWTEVCVRLAFERGNMSPHLALWLAISGACLGVAVGFPRPAAAIDVNAPRVNIPRPAVTVPTPHPSTPPTLQKPVSPGRVEIRTAPSGTVGVDPPSTQIGKTSSDPSTGMSGPNSANPNSANNQTAGQTVSAKPSATGRSPGEVWTNGCGSRSKVANCRQAP